MTEEKPPPVIPPKPSLPPRKLKRELKKRERRRQASAAREQRAREKGEDLLEPTGGVEYHGHRVIAGEDLRSVFTEDPRIEPIRRRYRRWHLITIAVLSGVLVVATVLAILISRGVIALPSASPSSAVSNSCPTVTFEYPENISITVNVFNSTLRTGLAASVAKELKKRGYRVGSVGDGKISTEAAGVIVSGSAGQAAAYNLQKNFPKMEYRRDDRSDSTVDVYLAQGFAALTGSDEVDHAPGVLVCRQPTS
ncbi:LytR C-terminal domain-containing protein [Psychromicrobium sp. YIM B11713]|uniref:LytR C-terminal domain-containing protein n=1 Tax=Psychromicrobium sp. YIM B11713 TaxID=3145233 RepID=UPI00374F6032